MKIDRVDGVNPTDTTSHGLSEQQRIDIERQEAMINDLIQLTRLQNTELNNLREEIRRISASAATEKDEMRAEMEELKQQVSALRAEQQEEKDGKSGDDTPTKLTRKAHVAIRDQQTIKDKIIAAVKEDVTGKILELEGKQSTLISTMKGQISDLEKIMSSVLSGIGCLYKTIVPPSETRDEVSSIKHYYDHWYLEQSKDDLIDKIHKGSGLSSVAKQQIVLQHEFSELSKALEQRLSVAVKPQVRDVEKEEKPAHMQKQVDKLSKTIDSQLQVIGNHRMSISSHSEEIGKIQNFLDILLLHLKRKDPGTFSTVLYTPTWNRVAGGMNTLHLRHDDSVQTIAKLSTKVDSLEDTLQELTQRLVVVENMGSKHENSLFSNCKNLVILQKRLSYAEECIEGSSEHPFIIRGKSFYEDAATLRYVYYKKPAQQAFSKFYGSRAEATSARFFEIAPPAVLMAFDTISRVRCRPEIWEGKLYLKRILERLAEKMIDSWEKKLPLREGDEYVPWNDQAFTKDENRLKLYCGAVNMGFDPNKGY